MRFSIGIWLILFSLQAVTAQTELAEFGASAAAQSEPVTAVVIVTIPQGAASVRLSYQVHYSFTTNVPVNRVDSTYKLSIVGDGVPSGIYIDEAGTPYTVAPLYALQAASGCVRLGAPLEITGPNGTF